MLEEQLKRIADALEAVLAQGVPTQHTLDLPPNEPGSTGDPVSNGEPKTTKKKRAKKKTARKAEPEPEPFDYDKIRKVVVEIVKHGDEGKDAVRKVLKSYGVVKASEVPPAKHPELYEKLVDVATTLETVDEDEDDFA